MEENPDHSEFRRSVRSWALQTLSPALSLLDRDQPLGIEGWRDLHKSTLASGPAGELPRDESGRPDWIALGILLEEVARLSCPVAMHLVNQLSVCEIILPLLSADQRSYYADYLDGHSSLAGGFTEAGAGSDPGQMRTTAERQGENWVIDGSKLWVTGASLAGMLLVSCRIREQGQPDGFGLFLVESSRGWKASDIPMLGLNMHPVCEIAFDNVIVPAIARVGADGNALGNLQVILAMGRCTMAAMSVGIGQGALDATLAYVTEREQFGRKIGSLQLVQEMVVDMATEVQCGRLLMRQALHRVMAGRGPVRLETSMAKMYCTEMCVRVTSLAIQAHGAMGLARETGIERMFRDARMMTIPDGTTQIQKLIVGRELTGLNALRG